ncbi:MAG: hypothetical protein J0G32_03105 [Alphaproteobacteria bacterium]|nr:hypothetical protein [Alphaproteobacteria bacterium]OJV16329.1 MAG: hypothetical protein BGO27_03685 [Alphaproteobacteria bacterium 33-17]
MTNKKKIIIDMPNKHIYQGKDLNSHVMHFTDEVTDLYRNHQTTVLGKGVVNNKINALIMSKIANIGIHTHYIKALNMREQAVRISDPVNITVRFTNVTTEELATKFNLVQGMVLKSPVMELFVGNSIAENLSTDEQIVYFGVVDPFEMEEIKHISSRINDFLQGFFSSYNIRLVSVDLKFAKVFEEDYIRLVLADEITPDTTRLLDLTTNEVLDSSFSLQTGMDTNYLEVAKRMGLVLRNKPTKRKLKLVE